MSVPSLEQYALDRGWRTEERENGDLYWYPDTFDGSRGSILRFGLRYDGEGADTPLYLAWVLEYTPDEHGRRRFGYRGAPTTSEAPTLTELNRVYNPAYLTIDGKRYRRTGATFDDLLRDAGILAASLKGDIWRYGANVGEIYSEEWGYLIPAPIADYILASTAAAYQRAHGGGFWDGPGPFMLALSLFALPVAASVAAAGGWQATVGASALGDAASMAALESFAVAEFTVVDALQTAAKFVDTGDAGKIIRIGGDIVDDWGGFSFDDFSVDDFEFPAVDDSWYPSSGDDAIFTATGSVNDVFSDDAIFDEFFTSGGVDDPYEYADAVEAYGGVLPEPVTLSDDVVVGGSVIDAEDADIGRAMRQARAAGSSFDFNKFFKNAAGEVFKLVRQQSPSGQRRVVPAPVRLANGQFANVNAAGQLSPRASTSLPFQVTGSQVGDVIKQYALPLAAVGLGAVVLLSRRSSSGAYS